MLPELPEAKCIHKTNMRFRVRIAALKGDEAFFAHVQERLAQCPLVTAVQANPLTGSVLISHSGELGELRTIAQYAETNKLFRLAHDGKTARNLMQATATAYRALDSKIQKLSGRELDLPRTAFLTFIGTGLYQLARGRFVAPAWHTAFWYAFNIFLKVQAKKGMSRQA